MVKKVLSTIKAILFENKKRIENLEHFVLTQQEHLNNLQKEKDNLEHFVLTQQKHLNNLQKEKDNLEHFALTQQEHLNNLQKEKDNLEHFALTQQEHLNNLQKEKDNLEHFALTQQEHLNNLQKEIKKEVAKQILYNTIPIQQRLDQLIFDLKFSKREPNYKKYDLNLFDNFYLEFENLFRGDVELVKKRAKEYLQYIDINTVEKALDIASGRGEWVELLQEHNIDAIGVDINQAMTEEAKKREVSNIIQQDAFEFLKSQEDDTFDLVSAFHLVEHLELKELFILLKEIKRVLKKGGTILLETPNPKNMLVSTLTFYKDPTHKNPVVDETLSFILSYLDFQNIQTRPLHPFPKSFHIEETTQSAKLLNELLFGPQDYLIIGKNNKV